MTRGERRKIRLELTWTFAALLLGAGRALANTYTVTTTADTGAGSLRKAITDANARFGADTIVFNLSGSGPFVITPTSTLPSLFAATTVDGTSQPGYVGSPLIVIDGSATVNLTGLTIQADCTVTALVVHSWDIGLSIIGDRVAIESSWIGVDGSGSVAPGFGSVGIEVAAADCRIEDCVVSGSTGDGIRVKAAGARSTILRSFIGTDVTGSFGLPNSVGIRLEAVDATIGGGGGDGNLVAGNSAAGLRVTGAKATNAWVEANVFGSDAAGVGAVPNGRAVELIVSSSGSTLVGNTIVHSSAEGIYCDSLGGERFDSNLLADNGLSGLILDGLSNGSVVVGNEIARNGNHGLVIAAANQVITSNSIHDNAQVGVLVITSRYYNSGQQNRLQANSIWGNGDLGIDLGGGGKNYNDYLDVDLGANELQNDPFLHWAATIPGGVKARLELRSKPLTTYDIEIFGSASADPEGESYLATTSVTTDAGGIAKWTVVLPPWPSGSAITATATDPLGNTSEFGAAKLVDQFPPASGKGIPLPPGPPYRK